MNNREFGAFGEEIAYKYLLDEGYQIVERNVHFSKFCEIDIVAKDKNTVVFVEVKTRKTNDFGSPFEAITKTKFENLVKGALMYVQQHKTKNYRIDVIGITINPDLKIEHMKNISLG